MKPEILKEKLALTKDGLTTRIYSCLDEYIGFAIDSELSSLIIYTVVNEVLAFHLDELTTQISTIEFSSPEEKDRVLENINKIRIIYEQAARNSRSVV
jgi:hypothetical protein